MADDASILQRLSKSFDLKNTTSRIDKFIGPLQTAVDEYDNDQHKKLILRLIKSLDKCQTTLQKLDAALTSASASSTQLRTAVHDAVIAQQIIVKLVHKSNYARVFDNDQYFYQLSSIMVDQTIVESLFIFIYSYTEQGDQSSVNPGGDAHE